MFLFATQKQSLTFVCNTWARHQFFWPKAKTKFELFPLFFIVLLFISCIIFQFKSITLLEKFTFAKKSFLINPI